MTAPINVEVDLGIRGGVVRFKTVQDVANWIEAESEFWAFLRKAPAAAHMGNWNLASSFFAYESSVRSNLDNIPPMAHVGQSLPERGGCGQGVSR
jgi:hypothetical protein